MELDEFLTVLGRIMILSSNLIIIGSGGVPTGRNINRSSLDVSGLPDHDITLDMIGVSIIDDHTTYGSSM